MCAAEARRRVGAAGVVVGVESHAPLADEHQRRGPCNAVVRADARDPLAVQAAVLPLTEGRGADLTLSCVNVGGVEMAAILATKDRGKAYFFAMSTSFTRAALGAEGCGRDVDLYIGNGYAHGHAAHTLDLVRGSPELRTLLGRRYG